MSRPRRSTAEAFYDVFADFTIEDQAAALKILEQVHRLAIREAKRLPAPPMLEKRAEDGLFPTDRVKA